MKTGKEEKGEGGRKEGRKRVGHWSTKVSFGMKRSNDKGEEKPVALPRDSKRMTSSFISLMLLPYDP